MASAAIDSSVVLAACTIAWFALPAGHAAWAAIFGAVAAVALLLARGLLGAGIGHALLGLRTIDTLSGLPSFRLTDRVTVRTGGADDPFHLRPRAIDAGFEPPAPATPAAPPSRLRLVVDDGTTHVVSAGAVIGRDPAHPRDPRHESIAIPDLSRTVSKVHLQVTVTEAGPVVTDLRSANGTRLQGSDAMLTPERPTVVPWGTALLLGNRGIRLERRAPETP